MEPGPPQRWPGGGCGQNPCIDVPFHVVPLGGATWALRQDKCVTTEAPVMYLMVGEEAALLLDSGDLKDDGGRLLEALAILIPKGLTLWVHATHPHSDHVAGHEMLSMRKDTRIILEPLADGHVLRLGGDRTVTVYHAGSGHSRCDVCFFDSRTRYLFTGDVLYPGYLFIRNYASYKEGMLRLHAKVKGRYVMSFGAHIEMSRSHGLYPASGCRYQPDEVPLQQEPRVFDELVRVLSHPEAPMNASFAMCPKSNM